MSVLITGASGGIGAACAQAFAAAGFDLILTARSEEKLQSLARELARKHGIQADAFGLDVRSRAAIDGLVVRHKTLFDSVRILINNAGLAKGMDGVHEGSPDDWDEMIDTNVKGLLYVTRAMLPGMIQRGDGHVINIGSVAGHWVYPKGNVYCATKYAVRALTEGLRQDLHGTGIRVSEISPGMVETDFSRVRFGGDEKRASAVYAGTEPLTADDIAETVLWCAQRPRRVNIQEVVIFPTAQASVGMVSRKS